MDSSDLTTKQLDALDVRIRELLGYLHRLRARMDKQRFPPDDELYRLTQQANHAVHELSVHVHYLSCSGTTYLPRRPSP